MITSFKVGAIFQIKDEATTTIARMAEEMAKLAKSAATVREEFASLSSIRLGSITTRINAMVAAMDKGTTAATNMATATAAGAAEMDAGLTASLATARALTAQLVAAGRAGAGLRVPRGAGGGGGGLPPSGGGGRGGGGRHGPGFHMGRVGGSIPVYGGHAHASGPGNAGIIGGGIAGYVAWKAMHAAEELQDEQDKMRRQGRSEEQIRSITERAFEQITRQVPTATASDVLKSTAELTFTKGNFDDAVNSTAQALKIDALISNATGTKVEGQGFKMYRALEEKLVTQDKAHTDRLLGIMAQGTIATGGRVTGSDWFTFAKRAGVSWIHQDDAFVGTVVPTLIQSLGADTAGTALMTMYQTLMGAGTLSKQQYEAFDKLGLIDPDKVTHDKGGRVNVQPGGIRGAIESKGNLATWGRNFLAPALQRVPEEEREAYLAKIGRNRNTTRMFETFSSPAGIAQFDKDAALINKALGIDESYHTFTTKDPKGALEGFTKQFSSMMEALGGPAMQSAMPGIQALTSLFTTVAAAANAHPKEAGTATNIMTGMAAGAGLGFLIGLAGGPIGAGTGLLVGGTLGAAYSYMSAPNLSSKGMGLPRSAMATGAIGPGLILSLMNRKSQPQSPFGDIPDVTGIGIPPAIPGFTTTASAAKTNNTTVNANVTVKAETDDPHGLAQRILAEINKMISRGHLHNQGEGDSVDSSPYVTGIGIP